MKWLHLPWILEVSEHTSNSPLSNPGAQFVGNALYGIANDAHIFGKSYSQGHRGFITDLSGNPVGSKERLSAGMNTFQLFMGPADIAAVGVTNVGKEIPRLKWLREGGGKVNGFSISKGPGYGAKSRFDFHKLSNNFNSRVTSRMTIPKWLDGKKLPHWHRGKGNNLRYHRPWEIGPDGKRRW